MPVVRAGIKVFRDESIDRALRRFQRSCERSGLIRDMRESAYYDKPSDKRKRKRAISARRRGNE